MKINKLNPAHWFALLRFSAVTLYAFILHQLNKNHPKKPIVILYGHKLNSNLKALYLKLEEIDTYNYFFLSMDSKYVNKLKNNKIQALNGCKTSTAKILANCSVIVTDHGLHCLEIFLGRSKIKFMDVWHGIPFKGFSPEDFKIQHKYNAICVSSDHLKEIYIKKFGFESEKIQITGYGRIDLLLSTPTEKDYKKNKLPISKKTIITYAPTWHQDVKHRSIIPFGISEATFLSEIDALCEEFNITFILRTHLNSKIEIGSYKHITLLPHNKHEDTESLLRITDILITDWSSIYFDFLVLNRPTIFIETEHPFKKGLTIDETFREGAICHNIFDLKSAIILETTSVKKRKTKIYEKKSIFHSTHPIKSNSTRYLDVLKNLL